MWIVYWAFGIAVVGPAELAVGIVDHELRLAYMGFVIVALGVLMIRRWRSLTDPQSRMPVRGDEPKTRQGRPKSGLTPRQWFWYWVVAMVIGLAMGVGALVAGDLLIGAVAVVLLYVGFGMIGLMREISEIGARGEPRSDDRVSL